MKRRANYLFCIFMIFFTCSGCVRKDSEPYGQQKVLEYVDSICSEAYHMTGKNLVEETPDNMEYSFLSDERDLSFHVNSYLAPVYIDASPTSFYRRRITCDYVSSVHDLYRDELDSVLTSDPHYLDEHGWIYLLSFDDISRTVDTVLAADQVYQQELSSDQSGICQGSGRLL